MGLIWWLAHSTRNSVKPGVPHSLGKSGQGLCEMMVQYLKIAFTCILWFDHPTENLVRSMIPHIQLIAVCGYIGLGGGNQRQMQLSSCGWGV